MGHDDLHDCPFMGECATFADALIDEMRKGPGGLGCRGQSDIYRGKHCKAFACSYLSMVISDVLRHPGAAATREQTA